jgi:hypothetical protein
MSVKATAATTPPSRINRATISGDNPTSFREMEHLSGEPADGLST